MMMDDVSDYDATNALFQRGDFLRKLRELEAADEAERQREAANENHNIHDSSDTLHYETEYLNGQRYYDDYKHVNYRFIEFGCINGEHDDNESNVNKEQYPLMIEQDRSVGKGGLVWDAGFILAEHVIHEQLEWKHATNHQNAPKTFCELGAGTGITGLMVTAAMPQSVHMSLTDLPELMPLLNKNLALNNISNLQATAFPLAWGSNVTGNYDVILGADVVAGIYDPVKLAKTIYDLCHDQTIVYLAVNSRLFEIIATFETALGKLFEQVERRQPLSRNKNPHVSILVATHKRSNQ